MNEKADSRAARDDRLKQALRANLRRRKDQAKQRRESARDDGDAPDEPPRER